MIPKVSVIIVSWNVREYMSRCLQSLEKCKNDGIEVIVIDNASTDGSADYIRQAFPTVTLITNTDNRGFGKAVNQGIVAAFSEYCFVLNPDTEVPCGAIARLYEFMETHHKVGIAGPHLITKAGTTIPSVRGNPTFVSQALVLLKLHHVLGFLPTLMRYFKRGFDYRKEQEVTQIMGTAMMIRKKVIDQVGGFDESFFLLFEEVDFCKCVKSVGWQICYVPSVEIIDYASQSFRQLTAVARARLFNTSLLYYAKKHWKKWQWRIMQILNYPSLGLAVLAQVFNIKPRVRP